MAKKKQEEAPKGSPAWMATFSDLMNLLLCFFVLLFAMSSVDADKWEQVVASFNNAFSIFDSGSTAIGDGSLVGTGTTQLVELGDYMSSMGTLSEDTDTYDETGKEEEKTLEEQLEQANLEETEAMLDNIAELTERYNLEGQFDLSMDSHGKYIEITISGSVLFDSGKADLKEECKPLLSKVGDILRVYDGHNVEIIGHTDNVPMNSAKYESNDILSSARAISTAQFLAQVKGIDIERLSWTGRGEYDPIATNATAEGRAKNRRVEIRLYNSLNSD